MSPSLPSSPCILPPILGSQASSLSSPRPRRDARVRDVRRSWRWRERSFWKTETWRGVASFRRRPGKFRDEVELV